MSMRKCPYCERIMDRNGPQELRPTKDHFVPKSSGKSSKVVDCCWKCNNLKGDLMPFDWIKFRMDNPAFLKLTHASVIEWKKQNGITHHDH